ncbi:MAG TPA: hypothetical protein VMI72_16785 [Roseiarcus sp.]|nr:hypothetical protein [Roseiarcus sp.]
MRVLGLIGLMLALSGCASERTITFIYYPNRPYGDAFPTPAQFSAEAQAECAKYGLVAVHEWDNWADFHRVRTTFRCYAH